MTSLKVAVRVRPLTERESVLGSNVVVDVCGKDIIVTDVKVPPNRDCDHRVRVHRFTFDYGFWSVDPSSTKCASQKTVYEEFGRVVLNTLLEGYNSCVIAYGPSGSGKTYTMMGTKEENGLTPRICEGLFEKLTDKADNHLPFQIDISFMEIYNEQVFDLLQRNETGVGKKLKLRVREHPIHGPFVEGLTTHIVNNIDRVCDLLARGNENRVKAETHVHDRSTRSHVIFTIRCSQACLDESKPREVISKLHLVDLAGSEKAAPEFCNERVKEGGNINKSLVTLGNVISVLVEMSQKAKNGNSSQKRTFVPYRDSNLTWLLKDSLGGNSHTFMLAAVSPSKECYIETVSTLRYAQRAQFVMNKPVVNEDPGTQMIRNLKTEVLRLKNLLWTAEKLNRAYVMKPLPEIVQLRTVMEESAKRVDALTKHWFEKWLKTYNIVIKKAIENDEIQGVKSICDSSEIPASLKNQVGAANYEPNSSNRRSSLFSDSAECLIFRNGVVGFSKSKCEDFEKQSVVENSLKSLKNCIPSLISKRTSITASSPPKIRSYSDNSLRRISNSAVTPLLKFISLSENENFPVISYSWLTTSPTAETNATKPEQTNKMTEFSESAQIMENKLSLSSTNCVTQDISDGNPNDQHHISSAIATEKTTGMYKDANKVAILTGDDNSTFKHFISNGDSYNKNSTFKEASKMIKYGIKSSNCSDDESCLNKTYQTFKLKSYEPKAKTTPMNNIEQSLTESETKKCFELESQEDISLPGRKTFLNKEFGFGEQVIQESKNLLEYLKTIDHESAESSPGFCSPRRKDSEIMSLLSFSSFDVPFLRSLDDLSCNGENETELERRKLQNNSNDNFDNSMVTLGEKTIKNLGNSKQTSEALPNDSHEVDFIENKRGVLQKLFSYEDNNIKNDCSIHDKDTEKVETSLDSYCLTSIPPCRVPESHYKPNCEDGQGKPDVITQEPNITIQDFTFETDFKDNQGIESKNYNESDETDLDKPLMKLTKANLDLLEEELNEKTQENINYINNCIAFAQNLFDQKSDRISSQPCSIVNSSALTETEDEDAKPLPDNLMERVSKVSNNEGRKVYDFGCWGKEYSDHVENKMRKVEDEMKEIEIMLGKHFEENENKELEFNVCSEEILPSNVDNAFDDGTLTACANNVKEWGELVKDVAHKNSQNLKQNSFTFVKTIPDMGMENYVNDRDAIKTFSFDIAKTENKDELGQDCESDFNDALTLDSLDNFEAEMKAWAKKYLTKYESQNSNFSTSDKIIAQDETGDGLNEIFIGGNTHKSNNNGEDQSVNSYIFNDVHKDVQPYASKSICSVNSSSSDSITYVFVGKDENETPKIPEFSKSHCSSIISSVSLDSLEKTSLQYKPSFMSPRTLSIDSLVAEDLLEQLKKGKLPTATKQHFTPETVTHDNISFSRKEQEININSSRENSTSFSNFRLPEKQTSTSPTEHPFYKISTDPYTLNKQTSNTLNSNEKTLILNEHSFHLDVSKNYSADNKNIHEICDEIENYVRASENAVGNFNISNDLRNHGSPTNRVPDFSNSSRETCQQSTSHEIVTLTSSQTNLPHFMDKSIHETNLDVESEDDRVSGKLSMIFIPPPASFDKVESIDGKSSRSQSTESNAKNRPSVCRGTQTDDVIQIQPPSVRPSHNDANYIDLTSRMIELMTETMKYLKEQKHGSRNCCPCCQNHQKHKKVSPYGSSENDSVSDHSEFALSSYDRSKKRHLKQRSAVKSSKKIERSQMEEAKFSMGELQQFLTDENTGRKFAPMIKSPNTSHRISDSHETIAERLDTSRNVIGSPRLNDHEVSYPRYDLLEIVNHQKSILPLATDKMHQLTLPSPTNAELRLTSPKNHLQQLVEIRRRLVEETIQKKSDQMDHNPNNDNVSSSRTHDISNHRRRSTSSSSEGYLSSVSSRGVFSRLSETATGSGGLDNPCNMESMPQTPAIKENGTRTRPKLLEVHKSNQSQGTANNSWQNTSADSGAFFMDSPLAERHDFAEVDNLVCGDLYSSRDNWMRNKSIAGKFEERFPKDFGTSDHDADLGTSNIQKIKVDSSVRNRISDIHSLYPVSEDSPRINLLEEFKQNKKAELTAEIRRTRLSGYTTESRDSRNKPVLKSRTDLIKKLSDINYKVTREDIEHVLASVQADKAFLRRRRKVLLDKSFSPKVSVYSIPGSDEDLFPWDSYKQLPEPSLFIGTSA